MVTLKQQQAQINVMITALQSSLERLISVESNDEIKRAIFLHCAMILFYQKLQQLLVSSKFIDFFNKNLSHLLDEESNARLFQELKIPYKFELPDYLTTQKLFFMVEFSAVVVSEAQKSLDEYENEGDKFRKAGLILGVLFMIGLVALAITVVAIPIATIISLPALPIIASFAGVLVMMLLAGLICDRQHRTYVDYSLEMFKELAPVKHDIHAVYLSEAINSNKATIYPKGELNLPYIQNLLPENEAQKNIFRKIQPLFFALPKEHTITQDDLALRQSAML